VPVYTYRIALFIGPDVCAVCPSCVQPEPASAALPPARLSPHAGASPAPRTAFGAPAFLAARRAGPAAPAIAPVAAVLSACTCPAPGRHSSAGHGLLELLELVEARQNDVLARLLDFAREEDLVQDRIHLRLLQPSLKRSKSADGTL
jgi:hypothetical protein